MSENKFALTNCSICLHFTNRDMITIEIRLHCKSCKIHTATQQYNEDKPI